MLLYNLRVEYLQYFLQYFQLCILIFLVLPGVSIWDAWRAVGIFCQAFPFSAVLPVQPLQYLPTEDDGVEVKFLRKKTELKSAINGGIRFFVEESANDDDDIMGLDLTVKRNSIGQSISKIMAEKLIVNAFVAGITGEEPEKYGALPVDTVRVTSLFHKWM